MLYAYINCYNCVTFLISVFTNGEKYDRIYIYFK